MIRTLGLALPLLLAAACTPVDAGTPPAGIAELGQPAPDFTLTSVSGQTLTLSQQRGKTVVLEWFNPDCPYVKYAHGPGGPLKTQPAAAIADGVVWWAINSGRPGKQGTGSARNVEARGAYGMAYPVALDEDGRVGRSFDAKTTPQLVVIEPGGTMVYNGALDNAPNGRVKGDAPVNHLAAALGDLKAGRAVAVPQTKPYGCSVKY